MSDSVLRLHKTLLTELKVDYFPPTMSDERLWEDFLGVMKSLDSTPGGPLTPRDVRAVIALMRDQNRRSKGGGWSLRFAKILRDPETFRDLVQDARKLHRPRRQPVEVAATHGDTTVLAEHDPALEERDRHIREQAVQSLRNFRESMKSRPSTKNEEQRTTNDERRTTPPHP